MARTTEQFQNGAALLQEAEDPMVYTTDKVQDGMVLQQKQIDNYIIWLRGKGLANETVSAYQSRLRWFMRSLPEDRIIRRGSVSDMQRDLLADGLSAGTVNGFTTAVNGFLDFCGHREYQGNRLAEEPRKEQPELTRDEYMRILSAARSQGRERTYFVVKLLANTGIMLEELPDVTVEAVREENSMAAGWQTCLPDCLREELLDYAARKNISTGMIFVTRSGNPVNRSNLNHEIRALSHVAQVPVEKCTPICLRRLYRRTWKKVRGDVEKLVEREVTSILEEEPKMIGGKM
ncbi:MAG: hypothetical protein LUC32_00130 [Clostridiales bacterium]|nr:hypothetical protein [Clostridiales bacterium]